MSIKRVTTRAIDNGQITAEKIAANAVDSTKIADSSIVESKIASSAVTTAKIADLAITADQISANSVTADKIANGAVTSGKLSTGGPIWGSTYTDTGLGVSGVYYVSLTPSRSGDGETGLYFGTQTGFNQNAIILRESGVNGRLLITQNGTGAITLSSPSGVTFGSANMPNPVGSAPIYGARAWVTFNGTGTVAIISSGNVSSITDNGTGTYTVNFTTAMPNADYAVSGAGRAAATTGTTAFAAINIVSDVAPTTTAVRIRHVDQNTIVDGARISVVIHS